MERHWFDPPPSLIGWLVVEPHDHQLLCGGFNLMKRTLVACCWICQSYRLTESLSPGLRQSDLLQGTLQGLQVFMHLAQSALDLARLVQNLHAAGKGVVVNCEGALDGRGEFSVEIP